MSTIITKKSMNNICDKLIDEMSHVFGNDIKRIKHALEVLDFAEKIQLNEGGDAFVVRAAAILHDIGIKEAERKYNSSAGKYQEIEGSPIAHGILKKYEIPDDVVEHICKIIANHHSAKNIDSLEFNIIWDADNIVNLHEEIQNINVDKIQKIIEKRFKTKTGYLLARDLFLNN